MGPVGLNDVPLRTFNTPRGTVLASTVEATAADLVGYMRRAGGVDRVAGLLAELGEGVPGRCQGGGGGPGEGRQPMTAAGAAPL